MTPDIGPGDARHTEVNGGAPMLGVFGPSSTRHRSVIARASVTASFYRRLPELETHTHEHIHVENNLYFPRAIALEDRAGEPAAFAEGCGMPACGH